MDIINFKNPPNKTPFAPTWDYYICENNIAKNVNVNKLKNLIIDKEKEIINQYEYLHDWNTGLGENSLTSRSNNYNLLKWPETVNLKNAIRNTFFNFMHGLGIDIDGEFYIQCWANVLRKGQYIQKHHHWHSPYCFLGGHVCIQEKETSTIYINPITGQEYESKNEPGKITLFPNWLPHRTSIHRADIERITIAFDIIPAITYIEDIYDDRKDHWAEL